MYVGGEVWGCGGKWGGVSEDGDVCMWGGGKTEMCACGGGVWGCGGR